MAFHLIASIRWLGNQHPTLDMRSALDTIPGIGPKRKKALLKHFGSIKKIRAATLEELSAVPGMNRSVAENVLTRISDEESI